MWDYFSVWHSHVSEDVDCDLLGWDTMWYSRWSLHPEDDTGMLLWNVGNNTFNYRCKWHSSEKMILMYCLHLHSEVISPWRWRSYTPLKHWQPPTWRLVITTQKTTINMRSLLLQIRERSLSAKWDEKKGTQPVKDPVIQARYILWHVRFSLVTWSMHHIAFP
jgi:hypothetical protein